MTKFISVLLTVCSVTFLVCMSARTVLAILVGDDLGAGISLLVLCLGLAFILGVWQREPKPTPRYRRKG